MIFYGLLFCLDFTYYQHIGYPLDPGTARLALKEREGAFLIFKNSIRRQDWELFLIISSAMIAPVFLTTSRHRGLLTTLLALCVFLVFVALVFFDRNRKLPPALNVLRCLLAALLVKPPERETRVVKRLSFPLSPSKRSACNVLIFAVESLNDEILNSAEGRQATPGYHTFLNERGDGNHTVSEGVCQFRD